MIEPVLDNLKRRCTKSLSHRQLADLFHGVYRHGSAFYQPLLFLLARCSRNELIRQLEFLKAENEMLRARVSKFGIRTTAAEREWLIKLGTAIGPAVYKLSTVVAPSTYTKWVRNQKALPSRKRMGRPRTAEAVRELVLRIAKETDWGYTRILGELRKLGYTGISRQTVVNILKHAGIDPWSHRGPGTWDELLKSHADTLWQCDFFSKRIATRRGIRQPFALVFLNVATRRVWISPCTPQPQTEWVANQTTEFMQHARRNELTVHLVTRDRDRIYGKVFDQVVTELGARVRTLSFRSPNLNAYLERFIQSIQVECLDHFLIFGEKHFDYLVKEYVEHYHEERPHQELGNRCIKSEPPPTADGAIKCRTRLGGLLRHYCCHAA